MADRWKMNRIGLINVWFYDKEIFEFEDGKLLLRGQNGSGKSITTQSFVPFILDGDRTPSRLDPFGSADRKMDYYFLGEDKDEGTGYLFLEFKKGDQYRTLGIGQNARRGKPMTFWGFVILDNRRVEKDIRFYRESGDKFIPYDKLEMRKILGENTPFTTSPREYKSFVNQYLFGFDDLDQYEQLLRFLIKIRSQKLSGVMKPTQIYQILNDSLQTLSDEDLRPMVDAMEKMDSMQETLDGMRRALTNANAILREYTHYNRFMISRKAQNYIDAKTTFQRSKENYQKYVDEVESWKIEQKDKNLLFHSLQQEDETLRKEIEHLSDSNIENLDIKYQNLKKELSDECSKKEKKESQIKDKNDQIYSVENNLRKIQSEIEFVSSKIDKYLQDLATLQETIQGEFHAYVRECISSDKSMDMSFLQQTINELKNRIQEGSMLLLKTNTLKEAYEKAMEEENQNAKALSLLQTEFDELENRKEDIQDTLMTQVSHLLHNQYWIPKTETIQEASHFIEVYAGNVEYSAFQDVLTKDYEACRGKQQLIIASLKANQSQLQNQIVEKKKEISDIENQKEVEPQRDEDASNSRKLLDSVGIQAYPFYKTVDFSSDLNESQQAILEQQLIKAGILDALVVSDEDYLKIQKDYPSLLDTILHMDTEGTGTYSALVVDTTVSPSIQNATRKILRHFDEKNGLFLLKANGYFKHGLIEGNAKKEHSEFIGASARQRRKERILENLKQQMHALQEQMDVLKSKMFEINTVLEHMEKEFTLCPKLDVLNEVMDEMHSLQLQMEQLLKRKQILESETVKAFGTYKTAEKKMLDICTALPYARNVDTYNDVLEDIDTYKDVLSCVNQEITKRESLNSQLISNHEQKEQCLVEVDTLYLEKNDMDNKITSIENQMQQIDSILNRPEIIENAKKLKDVHNKQEEIHLKIEEVNRQLAVLDHDLLESNNKISELEVQKNKDAEYLSLVQKYFEEELSLKYLVDKADKSLDTCAKEAIALEEEQNALKNSDEMTIRLKECFEKNSSDLVNHNAKIEPCFQSEDKDVSERLRYIVTLMLAGTKLSLQDFVTQLKESIASQEELISEKDRELFEDILSQTIADKLKNRITDSRILVNEMSNLMKHMDTSMGMHFALEWKPVPPEENGEMHVTELERLLHLDPALISAKDEERVAKHFKAIVQKEKEKQEIEGIPNYMDLVRNALDYRKWYTFKMYYAKSNEKKKEMTNAAFNRFSGGERAMAMYVPLLAAVHAQYQKARQKDHPRLIALDEAFAGVDDKNIASMFEMVEQLDFDYIMNSQALWGCYDTVKHLKISELLRPMNANFVAVINYIWDGKEKRVV